MISLTRIYIDCQMPDKRSATYLWVARVPVVGDVIPYAYGFARVTKVVLTGFDESQIIPDEIVAKVYAMYEES